MNIVLISTYELGRQPFGLASPAAWLRAAGHSVRCADLAVCSLPAQAVRDAGLVAFYLPMHTATRLAVRAIEKVRQLNPRAHLCCYGLYAPLNEAYLRKLGVGAVLGGEFEAALASLAAQLCGGTGGDRKEPVISLARLPFLTPDRAGLPALERYGRLRIDGAEKLAGYTEATRGCKHLCRHCPVVPVYGGAFRVVQADVVLEDIRRQIAAGASHITFGDPDFFNGPTHAVRIVQALHGEFPGVSYDVTIKIEHLLHRRDLLPVLRETGCLFVTSAVESVDDSVLYKLEKGHTSADFYEVAQALRAAGLTLSPTFLPFTPWATRQSFCDLLRAVADLDLVENVAPVQLALRLLIPSGSRMLELDEIQAVLGEFDEAALLYPWRHHDPAVDKLAADVYRLVDAEQTAGRSRGEIFASVWQLAHGEAMPPHLLPPIRAAIPQMSEAWYCCAEPTGEQLNCV
ncbi:MAG: CUAEP/CCAEP-tail radical SAM (seleno)protein [Bryobacteraceae bacterium]